MAHGVNRANRSRQYYFLSRSLTLSSPCMSVCCLIISNQTLWHNSSSRTGAQPHFQSWGPIPWSRLLYRTKSYTQFRALQSVT